MFLGSPHRTLASLYKATSSARDASEDEFGAAVAELVSLLRSAGELPPDPLRTIRLRRVASSTSKRHFFHLVADLSDGATTGELSLKKACRFALKH